MNDDATQRKYLMTERSLNAISQIGLTTGMRPSQIVNDAVEIYATLIRCGVTASASVDDVMSVARVLETAFSGAHDATASPSSSSSDV